MQHPNPFLAHVLTRGARSLAAYAAAELLAAHPDARVGFQSDPLRVWQDWLAERLQELATAVATAESAIFTRQVQWANAMLTARGFDSAHVRFSLTQLKEVLERELPETVGPLAADHIDRALNSFKNQPADAASELMPDTPDGQRAAQYLLALFQGDRQRATRLILDALDEGYSVQDLVMRVLLPAQVEVGRMWHADEINVAEEHFASATTKAVMAQLMSLSHLRKTNGKTMLAAGVAGNHVDIGLQAVADFFEMDGWRAIQLGANVPTYDIVQAVEYFEADLVGLSASQSTQLETVRQAIAAIRSTERGEYVKVIVGGFAFAGAEHLAERLNADGYAPDPAAAVLLGRQLVLGSDGQADDETHEDGGVPSSPTHASDTVRDDRRWPQAPTASDAVSDVR